MACVVAPQPGPQEDFINATQSLVFYGGSAGGGKTWGILADGLKYIHDPNTFLVYFRVTNKVLEATLWPQAKKMYWPFLTDSRGRFKGEANVTEGNKTIIFPSGAKIVFSYMDHDKSAEQNWQGTELTGVYWDELCHFSEFVFNYLKTRLRSMTDFTSFIRASMNPEPDHWVLKYIDHFLDEDGFPDLKLCGRTRYFVVDDDGEIISDWDEQYLLDNYKYLLVDEAKENHMRAHGIEVTEENRPYLEPDTYTFIPSTIDDNPIMLQKNPRYKSNLRGNDPALVEALLKGNWYFRPTESTFFQYDWCEEVTAFPKYANRVRSWDLAASEPSQVYKNPDWTANVRMSKCSDGYFYIEDMSRFRKRPGDRDNRMISLGLQDTKDIKVTIPIDAGASGKSAALEIQKKYIRKGITCRLIPASNKSKLKRFEPFSAAAQSGLVRIVVVPGQDKEMFNGYFKELGKFTGEDNGTVKDDWVDATSDAFNTLATEVYIPPMTLPSLTATNDFNF